MVYHVSIVIPVYNGSRLLKEHLPPLLAWLENKPYKTQVIVVDDGSADRDQTAAFARENNLLFWGLTANKGKGAALRKGFAHAEAPIQLFTDADIPFLHTNIDTLVSALEADPAQLVIGDRTDPRSVYFDAASPLRNWGSNLVSALTRRYIIIGIRDTQCGLKGMGKDVARQLFGDSFIDRFAIDIELICLAAKKAIPVRKIPVQLRYNDKSSIRVVKDGAKLLLDIYRIRSIHGKRTPSTQTRPAGNP